MDTFERFVLKIIYNIALSSTFECNICQQHTLTQIIRVITVIFSTIL
jgi:hypothetical protein